VDVDCSGGTSHNMTDQVAAFSNRISLVGKARASAGALNLLRILAHPVIAQPPPPIIQPQQSTSTTPALDASTSSAGGRRRSRLHNSNTTLQHQNRLREAFCYKSREQSSEVRDTAADLLAALLEFVCHTPLSSHHSDASSPILPELYDCMVLALQLLTVLLGTQLYQPLQSSFQRTISSTTTNTNQQRPHDYFWQILLEQSQQQQQQHPNNNLKTIKWSPRQLLRVLLSWHMQRPSAPEKSIQYHACALAEQVVTAKGEKKSGDGLYESHWIVQAAAPPPQHEHPSLDLPSTTSSTTHHHPNALLRRSSSKKALLDATRGALVLSSQILLMLPFRLMSLALHLWGHGHGSHNGLTYDESLKQHFQINNNKKQQRTRDVLWLTQSPVADIAASLLLLLSNTERATPDNDNAFRRELHALADNRWDTPAPAQQSGVGGYYLPDLPPLSNNNDNSNLDASFNGTTTFDLSFSERYHPEGEPEGEPLLGAGGGSTTNDDSVTSTTLTVNFELLFESFGVTAHTEPGALLLYTLLQASPTFAASLAVRSDLDTLVLPLLRTLYFATSLRHHVAQDYAPSKTSTSSNGHPRRNSEASVSASASLQNCPFRSISQLYVIIILLLLFSQDASFGADAFRRVMVPTVPWYKERYLKDISLGSVLILALLRCLTFNLNRQNDAFLLSNCCAVLMNLSPSVVELHEYAALRLTALAVSVIKRYLQLRREHPDNDDDDLTTPTSMHGEAARTLLCTLKHCVSAKNLETNLHVVYALVYHQSDFKRLFAATGGSSSSPFVKSEVSRILTVITTAARIIDEDGTARTAPKALKILRDHIDEVKEAVTDRRKRATAEAEDFTFTYEEEADPEIFFVPYLWEVIVCVVTSTSIEWNKNRIQVFPLLEEEPEEEDDVEDEGYLGSNDGSHPDGIIPQFARDVSDVV